MPCFLFLLDCISKRHTIHTLKGLVAVLNKYSIEFNYIRQQPNYGDTKMVTSQL